MLFRTVKYPVLLLLVCLLALPLRLCAQQHRIYSENIHTLRVVKNGDVSLMPALALGSRDLLEISFDDLTHVYHRYTYRVVHCNADWTPSEGIFESDYLDGFNDDANVIDDYQPSLNTSVLYTHYRFTLPNRQMRLRLSGNYRVDIFDQDADDERPVCSVCFYVYEQLFGLGVKVSTNTDVDWNKSHQQLEMNLTYGGVEVQNADREIHTVVMQNGRTDNCVRDARPTFQSAGGLQWVHQRDLIFTGGNEYRKFEILNVHLATLGVDRMRWYEPYYHAQLWQGAPRRNYVTDEDQNGLSIVRREDNQDNDIQSDYIVMHYSLATPERQDGSFYVNGRWSYDCFTPEFQMTYDNDSRSYVADILQKQGYYNYQYLFLPAGQTRALTAPAEGDFYQTENQYTIIVYYRGQDGRYDRIAAFRDFRFSPSGQ